MNHQQPDIFDRMRAGGMIPMNDPEYPRIRKVISRTIKLSEALNSSKNVSDIRERLSEITGQDIDRSTIIFAPFHTNFGRHISIGKNVFINHACSFLDMGGIVIEDDVLIGPRVNITSENHPIDPNNRRAMDLKAVHIKRNAWIGAAATILPGVTIGENSVIAAGAVVTKNVPPNVVVGGVPAQILQEIDL